LEAAVKSQSGARILRLHIERYRAFDKLDWWPQPGLNVILGGGDAGKSTILDAIALLLSPSNATTLSDNDYRRRDRSQGFMIGAVISLPPAVGMETQARPAWPWEWDGQKAVAPHEKEDGSPGDAVGEPVFKIAVRGTDELDLEYEVRCPNGWVDAFTPHLRRQVGIVRLSGDDRNDRDLRLVQGSALDRLLTDRTLRARLGAKFSDEDLKAVLLEEGRQSLADLDAAFESRALPHDLSLGLASAQGQSISALIGLTAAIEDGRLPLSSWGSGTRRLASLAVAQASKVGAPITLVDEAERGLEPYRQRKLVRDLASGASQVFMTTHSAPALVAAQPATVWHLTPRHEIGELAQPRSRQLLERDPEAFLARLALIAEGPTEVGFLKTILRREIPTDLLDLGVRIANGGGNQFCRELLEEFQKAKFAVGAVVDNEGDAQQSWTELGAALGDLFFQWANGCTEQNVMAAVPAANLEALLIDPEGHDTQHRLNTLVDRLKAKQPDLVFPKHDFAAVASAAGAELRALMIAAACGHTEGSPTGEAKTWKKHGKCWFKSEAGGEELAAKMYELGAWTVVKPVFGPFLTALIKEIVPEPAGVK
jgi:putative ATP-dependent endonuclease of OLD family